MSDRRKDKELDERGAHLFFCGQLLQQHQGNDRSGLSSFGETRIECRISSPSPPFSLMEGEQRRLAAPLDLMGTKRAHAEESRSLVQFHLITRPRSATCISLPTRERRLYVTVNLVVLPKYSSHHRVLYSEGKSGSHRTRIAS